MAGNNGSPMQTVGIAISLGIVAHQLFRKYETYNIGFQFSVLCIPPALLAIFAKPSRWSFFHALFSFYTTYLITLISSVVVYRLSPLHPLARYPGPIACKITKFYMGFLCIPGYQHKHIKSLHDLYGDVVRIGPNELSIRNPSVLNALVGTSGAAKGPHFFGRVLSETNLPMVGITDTEQHLRRRRNWNRAMSPAAIKEYEHFISQRVRQLLEKLETEKGEILLGQWVNFWSYDFMSDMAFGGGSELIKVGHDRDNVWSVLDEAMFIATFFGHVPWLGVLIGKIPGASGNLKVLLDRCAECAVARVKRGSERKDLFHYLNNEDLPDKPPSSTQQLIDDGILAIVAGADTISSTLTSVFYFLLSNPDVYERLQKEVDKFYPVGENALDINHHRDMPYLAAVINETLRVLPAVPGGSQRQVPYDSNGIIAGDIVLPPGTIFWPHIYSHHHDHRSFFPLTSSFWPERWLLATGELAPTDPAARGVDMSTFVHNEAGFMPFSQGPMNCVGKTLAMQELKMFLCGFLQKYRMKLRVGWDPRTYEREYRDYFTAPRPDLPVTLEARF